MSSDKPVPCRCGREPEYDDGRMVVGCHGCGFYAYDYGCWNALMSPPARPAFPECAPGPWDGEVGGTVGYSEGNPVFDTGSLGLRYDDSVAVRDFILARVNAPRDPGASEQGETP